MHFERVCNSQKIDCVLMFTVQNGIYHLKGNDPQQNFSSKNIEELANKIEQCVQEKEFLLFLEPSRSLLTNYHDEAFIIEQVEDSDPQYKIIQISDIESILCKCLQFFPFSCNVL